MSADSNQLGKPVRFIGKATSLVFILVIMIMMMIAGGIALDEGTGRFMKAATGHLTPAYSEEAIKSLRANPTPENMRIMGSELWGISKLTSTQHITDSRLPEQGLYYTVMPQSNKVLMVVHIIIGSFCMLLGGLQFWPYFRKKYMKAHRTIGAIYIVTVPISVIASLIYLVNTAPHHIYDHLVAWIALWIFGVLSLISIAMAVRALRAKRIYEHQAWMALSFASLMVAPLLRWDWVILGILFPSIDQETLNLVTMGVMLPECLLIAYGLILINRQYARPMSKRPLQPIVSTASKTYISLLPVLYLAALLSLAINIGYYLIGDGLSNLTFAEQLIPSSLIQHEKLTLSALPLTKAVYVLAVGFALPLALYTLKNLFQKQPNTKISTQASRIGIAAAVLAVIGGAAALSIGWQIGLATQNIWLSGGTMYSVDGALLVFFGVFYLIADARQQIALMKESLVFMLCLLPFSALYVLTLGAMSLLPLPPDYVAAGQGFVIPVGFGGALLFLALITVIYGQATREHN
ncbi:DUF2306 domain-containing protein [Aquirhabdus sp.]|uniref:DUF2306 domain-containing protein n=1 Tax=Aquirhabdus sp. TaxID=2824160 RepID=UPI00396C76D2